MTFQSSVNFAQAIGQPGDFYDDTPRRVTAYKLEGIDRDTPSLGRVFTLDSAGLPQLGGEGAFAGILCNPMSLARQGLDATQGINQGTGGELADRGRLIVRTQQAALPGQSAVYSLASGDIVGPLAGDTPAAGTAVIPGGLFVIFEAEAGGLAVLQIG